MAFPDSWQEVCFVGIVKYEVTPVELEFAAVTNSIELGVPDYPGESIPTLSGGRIWKQSPQEDGEITLEIRGIELDIATGVGLFQQFTGGLEDSSEPLETDTSWPASVDRTRDRFRITCLWTNDPAATTAIGATAASTDSLRFSAMGCRMTGHKHAFTDGELVSTATFKFPAYNKAGTVKMFKWGSGDQTALVAIPAYDDDDSWT